MSERRWIPGPWRVDPPIGAEHAEVRDKDGRRIAIAVGRYPMRTATEDANANLIAAAPDLYQALADLVREIESVGFGDEWDSYDTARAALAKARGERDG